MQFESYQQDLVMAARVDNLFDELTVKPSEHAFANNHLNLIGFACGIGANNPGCAKGPEVLKQLGLSHLLHKKGINAKWQCFLKTSIQELDQRLQIDYLSLQFRILAKAVAQSISKHEQFTVIGGDHSCAIGTWSGAAHQLYQYGPLGLIWIDAHMDSHTFITSHSGALHGMPLACLLGYGDRKLTNILYKSTKIAPHHICLVGVRSYETEEERLLKHLGVKIIYMQEVKRYGLKNALKEALDIATKGTAGFGVSIDLDCIDPFDAPGVGTPELDGILKNDLLNALKIFPKQNKFLGIEIAELNPTLDQNNITATLAMELIVAGMVNN